MCILLDSIKTCAYKGSGGTKGGMRRHLPQLEALSPLAPPVRRTKWQKSAICSNFVDFSPSDTQFSPSMPPNKNFSDATTGQRKCTDMHAQWLQDRIDFTTDLKSYRLYKFYIHLSQNNGVNYGSELAKIRGKNQLNTPVLLRATKHQSENIIMWWQTHLSSYRDFLVLYFSVFNMATILYILLTLTQDYWVGYCEANVLLSQVSVC